MAGAPFIGDLEFSGLGVPCECSTARSKSEALKHRVSKHNAALQQRLSEDACSAELLKMTRADAEKGRMTQPTIVKDLGDVNFLLAPRFGVEQLKPDGSIKVRPVDHYSWSPDVKHKKVQGGVNGATSVAEKLKHDTIDHLWIVLEEFKKKIGTSPGLLKVDVDSAYRCIIMIHVHRRVLI